MAQSVVQELESLRKLLDAPAKSAMPATAAAPSVAATYAGTLGAAEVSSSVSPAPWLLLSVCAPALQLLHTLVQARDRHETQCYLGLAQAFLVIATAAASATCPALYVLQTSKKSAEAVLHHAYKDIVPVCPSCLLGTYYYVS